MNKTGLEILKKRYLKKDSNGNVIEEPIELFIRVATAVAKGDNVLAETFYDMMWSGDFLPNSPTLMNAGRVGGGQLSACFVLPIDDSMESIFDAIKNAALVSKSGGGTGFDFSKIRPKNSVVASTGGIASGPVSFMKVFNSATDAVKQGGSRRGANMGMLHIDHQDIEEFITCKDNTNDLTNFNISVGITNEFMTKVKERNTDAMNLFNIIATQAWKNGEPGIVFLDTVNRWHKDITGSEEEINATNPCGEQPLLPYESCNLGSINLVNMINPNNNQVDIPKLKRTVQNAVIFLNNVIDINYYPLPQIEEKTKQLRKIGLGVMGFADMLYLMNIPYNSREAITLAKDIMRIITATAHVESINLVHMYGCVPNTGRSNGTLTTIAPTGTISMLAGVSSGIEPLFALAFKRNQLDTQFVEINPIFERVAKERGFYSDELIGRIEKEGSIQHIKEIPDDVKKVFVTTHDIDYKWHVRMQAAWQESTDNAVSKTINLPHSATIEDVKEAYMLAYDLGCKGITVYRDGSRESQVLTTGTTFLDDNKPIPVIFRERPTVTHGYTEKVNIGCGNLYVTVNSDYVGVCEVFTSTGKTGGCPSQSEATARLASLALRSGVSVSDVSKQLKGIRCMSCRNKGVLSCPDAIGKALEKTNNITPLCANTHPHSNMVISEFSEQNLNKLMNIIENNAGKPFKPVCTECGSAIQHEGGCTTCKNCGHSKCG